MVPEHLELNIGRAPMRGVWIEMLDQLEAMTRTARRAPMRGVWIEMQAEGRGRPERNVAPPCGACGLKCCLAHYMAPYDDVAPPMRGVWIEMSVHQRSSAMTEVAPPCGACGLK